MKFTKLVKAENLTKVMQQYAKEIKERSVRVYNLVNTDIFELAQPELEDVNMLLDVSKKLLTLQNKFEEQINTKIYEPKQ